MLHPKKMTKVKLIAAKSYQATVIQKLYSLGALHIIEHSKSFDLDIGKPISNAFQLSDSLVKIRSLISLLKSKEFMNLNKNQEIIKNSKHKQDSKYKQKIKSEELSLPTILVEVVKLHEEISTTLQHYRDIETEIKKNKSLLSKMHILKKLELNLNSLEAYETLTYFVGYVEKAQEFANSLRAATSNVYIKTSLIEGKHIVAVFIDNNSKQKITPILEQHKFIAIDLSELQLEHQKRKEFESTNTKSIEDHILLLEQKKEKQSEKMSLFSKKYIDYLNSAEKFVVVESEKAEVPLKFASTDETFIASGWIPADKVDYVISEIRRITKDKLYYETTQPHSHDSVPIQLDNPKSVKSFEMLMHLYSLPKFHEIDPTFFIFLTFPLFFGFMLGDIGYGIITLILFLILKWTMPKAKGFFNILIAASIMTIFFGFIFGEFFGYEQIGSIHLWHLLSRSVQIMDLLTWAIVIGIIHINLALLIGFYNIWHQHGFMKAVYEKMSWILLQVAIAVGYFVNVWAGVALGVVSIIFLWLGEGVKGLIELPSIFSNILSYARLMALGVASVKLAEVINEFAGEFFHQGGIGILWAVLLLIIGHLINIGLGIIGPFLHSLRLHYVEFFTKFFEGGGIAYSPFGQKEETD